MRTPYLAVGGKIAAGMRNTSIHRASWVTYSCAVLSSAVHSTSGESNRIFTAALMVTVFIPVAVSAPVYGSYSITAPSGNDHYSASAKANRTGYDLSNARKH